MKVKKIVCVFLFICIMCCSCEEEIQMTKKQREYAQKIYSFFISNSKTTSIGFDSEIYLNTIFLINENDNYYLSGFYSTEKNYKENRSEKYTRSGPGVYISYLFKNGEILKSDEDYAVDKIGTDVRGIATWYSDYTKDEQINVLYDIVSNF